MPRLASLFERIQRAASVAPVAISAVVADAFAIPVTISRLAYLPSGTNPPVEKWPSNRLLADRDSQLMLFWLPWLLTAEPYRPCLAANPKQAAKSAPTNSHGTTHSLKRIGGFAPLTSLNRRMSDVKLVQQESWPH